MVRSVLQKQKLDRQKAIKRMLWTFFFAFVLIFPVFRLGSHKGEPLQTPSFNDID